MISAISLCNYVFECTAVGFHILKQILHPKLVCYVVPHFPTDLLLATIQLCFLSVTPQLFEVTTANEWKSINITIFFPENDESSISVKCSTWSADGKKIIGAAKNAVFVS